MLRQIIKLILSFTFVVTLFIRCNGGEMAEKTVLFPTVKEVPASAWENLSEKKIYFGHQSVGVNILEGIRDLARENPKIRLHIVESEDLSDFGNPVFVHARVGKNTDPISKIDAFQTFIQNRLGNKADIAFFKFCYVDFAPGSDVFKVFESYKDSMATLKKEYPGTKFIHLTIPLTQKQTGPKAWVKRVIGKPIGGIQDNVVRNRFNELMRKEYEGREPLFDLAGIESTFPDGQKCSFVVDGKTYVSLTPEYTYDGGHLNKLGRKIVAEQLLIFLANMAN
jgi:hypothetical protein